MRTLVVGSVQILSSEFSGLRRFLVRMSSAMVSWYSKFGRINERSCAMLTRFQRPRYIQNSIIDCSALARVMGFVKITVTTACAIG
jgi:hypothetical protein